MGIDINRIEDLELLLGITSLRNTLDKVIESIWIPFWRHLPKHIRTPRTLLNNKEIIFSMLESVGSRLVSEHVLLFQENKELKTQSNNSREELLATYSALVPYAQSCQVHDFTNPAFDSQYDDFNDLENIFSDEDIVGINTDSEQRKEDLTPYWSLRITFIKNGKTFILEKILSHQEYVMHFADKSEVVYKPFSTDSYPTKDPFEDD